LYILWPSGIFCCYFGIFLPFRQEKSGNPDVELVVQRINAFFEIFESFFHDEMDSFHALRIKTRPMLPAYIYVDFYT
jgi:hypothetical protein